MQPEELVPLGKVNQRHAVAGNALLEVLSKAATVFDSASEGSEPAIELN